MEEKDWSLFYDPERTLGSHVTLWNVQYVAGRLSGTSVAATGVFRQPNFDNPSLWFSPQRHNILKLSLWHSCVQELSTE